MFEHNNDKTYYDDFMSQLKQDISRILLLLRTERIIYIKHPQNHCIAESEFTGASCLVLKIGTTQAYAFMSDIRGFLQSLDLLQQSFHPITSLLSSKI